MPRACRICTHDEREEIDAALISAEPYRNIAERYGVSVASLSRHVMQHLLKTLAAAREAERVADDLYYSIRPMLAVSGGRLVALSTPFGKRGWFFRE